LESGLILTRKNKMGL